jgi:2,4-dienoyl-CoA reductase-like NADH-dependent reductase (Old Yellow Enzyme family)
VKVQLTGQTNLRTDAYGGSAEKRAKFVLDILSETRKVLPATFCIGIKFNSADHSSASFEDTMTQIGLLVDAGIDFLEVSGGSYEDLKVRPTPLPNPTTRNNPDKKTDDEH